MVTRRVTHALGAQPIGLLAALLIAVGAMLFVGSAQAAKPSTRASAPTVAQVKKCQAVLRKGSSAGARSRRACGSLIRRATRSGVAGPAARSTFDHSRGSITIVKDVDPEPDGTDVSFSTSDLGGASFILDDDNDNTRSNQKVFSGLNSGTYSVTETVPAGYILKQISCSDSNSTDASNPDGLTNTTATIKVSSGEDVTCTFKNIRLGTVVIQKTATGGDGTFGYTATSSGITTSFDLTTSGGAGSKTFSNLVPGTKSVTETAPTGWDLTNLVCSDPDNGSSVAGATATIDLDAGETVTCTYTNRKRGTVVIQKTATGGDGTFGYTATSSGVTTPFDLTTSGGAGSKTFSNLLPGTKSVTETAPTGWDLTNLVCSDPDNGSSVAGATATIDLDAGETVTCTYTNTKRGSIKLIKQTLPDGDLQEFTFTGELAGAIKDGEAIGPKSVASGSYDATEVVPAGWDLTQISCDDTNSSGNLQTATATFNVAAGEDVVCIFTNTKRGTITVTKQTVPDASAGTFEFDPSYAANFSLSDGQSNASELLAPGAYSVAELQQDIWVLTDISCSGGDNTYFGDGSQESAFGVGDTLAQIDLDAGEDVTCTFTNTRRPDFVITKKATPNPANFGQEISYTIEVSHIGENLPIDLSNFDVTDKFADQNVTEPLFREPGDDIGNDGMLSQGEVWSYGVLDAQENWGPLKRTADVCGDIVNTATIAPRQVQAAPADAQNPPVLDDPGNHVDTETVPVICTPDLQVVKTSEPAQVNFNDTITFTVAVSHAATSDGSPVAGANVKVTDPKVTQGELVLVSGDDQDAVLELGETWIYQVTVDQKVTLPATTCGPITNTAILAQVPGETNLANNASTATVTVICTLDLGIQKTSDKDVYDAGQTINYTVTVTNNGQQAIPFSQIQVSDPQATLTLQGAAPADLAPGASLAYTASKATTTADCAQVVNTATVTYTGPNGPETTTANNSATRTVSVVCPAVIAVSPATVGTVAARTKLRIDKQGPLTATAGQLVTYRIKVTNAGQHDARSVVIRDTLPSGFTLARRVGGATFRRGVVTWRIGTLAVGKSKTVKLTVRIDKAIGGLRCNTGSARGSNAGQVRDAACTRIRAVAGQSRPAVAG